MMDPVRELKVRAELLLDRVRKSEDAALERLRVLPELRKVDARELRLAASEMKHKHCLAAVAREVGFASWDHARRVLEGDASEVDFGKLLYGASWGSQLNHWFATYDDAKRLLAEGAGGPERRYLLAYQRHFFVVDRHFIDALGLDSDDPDWQAIGWDWPRPKNADARRRLYAKLLATSRP